MQTFSLRATIRTDSITELLNDEAFLPHLENEVLPSFLPNCRWFRSKQKTISHCALEAWAPLNNGVHQNNVFAIIQVAFGLGDTERYSLPFALLTKEESLGLNPLAVLCQIEFANGISFLIDACHWHPFRLGLLHRLFSYKPLNLTIGILKSMPALSKQGQRELAPTFLETGSRILSGDQSNTAFVFESGHFLKLYRRLEENINPESEMLRFFQEKTAFTGVPEFQVEWVLGRPDNPPISLAILQTFLPANRSGWDYLLDQLKPLLTPKPDRIDLPLSLQEWAFALGKLTGDMHLALGSHSEIQDFAPEDLTIRDLSRFFEKAILILDSCEQTLLKILPQLAVRKTELFQAVQNHFPFLRDRLSQPFPEPLGSKIRMHGDFHLGQILCSGNMLWILDFEGEPLRPIEERRQKYSPLRDVAGMLRSFHYALFSTMKNGQESGSTPESHGFMSQNLDTLYEQLCTSFLNGYRSKMSLSQLLPTSLASQDDLLRLFLLEKAIYELNYELNNRPDWIDIPLHGLLDLTHRK